MGHRITLSDAVESWLHDYLGQHGPTPSSQVKEAAQEAGYSVSTLKRKTVVIRIESIPGTTQTMWSLPGEEAPAPQCTCPCTCGVREELDEPEEPKKPSKKKIRVIRTKKLNMETPVERRARERLELIRSKLENSEEQVVIDVARSKGLDVSGKSKEELIQALVEDARS